MDFKTPRWADQVLALVSSYDQQRCRQCTPRTNTRCEITARPYRARIGRSDHEEKPKPHDRYDLPYGMWICDDGTAYLFNRRYEPIC